MSALALAAYRAVTAAAEPALPLLLKDRLKRGKENEQRWPERLARTTAPRPPGPLVWLHGASVGEGLSLLPLVEALQAARPGLTVLVTTGTVTSAELLGKRLPPGAIHQFAPVDAPGVARRFLEHWRPDVAVFAESEVWPNLLREARARGVPTALVSARLSAASLANWRRLGGAARAVFGGYRLVLAQDDATAQGLAALGARDDGRLNLKRSGAPLAADAAVVAAAAQALGAAPVIVAASTHAGEEEIVLEAFAELGRPGATLLITPRHPERGPAVAALAEQAGFAAALRSAGAPLDGCAPVYVADTLGELGAWFALPQTRAVFVGGSLVPGPGGHNPLEPARARRPVLTGPHVQNWAEVYRSLGEAVLTVDGAGALASALDGLLNDPVAAETRAAALQARAEAAGGDLGAVAARLLALAGAGR